MITVEVKGYTLEDVKDNFWVLSRMYYNELYAIAFALTNDHELAELAVDRAFHSMSWCKIYDYESLDPIRQKLGEYVALHTSNLIAKHLPCVHYK